MKNVEMIKELSATLKAVRSGEMAPRVAREVINAADKMVKAAGIQLEYERTKKSLDQKIDFLEQE